MKKLFFGILFAIVFLNVISASFSLGTPAYEIEKSYASGDNLRGWINLKLSAEPNSPVYDSKGNSVYLLDLIRNSSSVNYSCSPSNCIKDYTASNPQTSKTVNAIDEQLIILGIKIDANLSVDGVTSVDLTIQGDAPADCRNQFSIDILDDQTVDITNQKVSQTACSSTKTFGCYDSAKTSQAANIYDKPYCQKIHLRPAPAYELGATIKRIGSEKEIRMMLFTLGNSTLKPEKIAECSLDKQLPHNYLDESCTAPLSLDEDGDYLVCILSDGTIEDSIRAYQDPAGGCGFSGVPDGKNPLTFSYSIFAQSKKYDTPGSLSFTEEKYSQWSLGLKYNDYIKKKYGNMDCTNGCIIPIKLVSHTNQKIIVKDLKMTYSTLGFGQPTTTSIYDLVEKPVTITTPDFQKISIDSGKFLVSNNFGQENVALSLNGNNIFSDTITVKEVPTPTSLTPTSVPAAVPTEFVVSVSATNSNITNYQWDFGDGKVESTTVNKITHSYPKIGSFILKISVTNIDNEKGFKNFNISVQSPEGFVNSTLKDKKEKLEEIKNSIKNDFSPFEQTAIAEAVDILYLESEIQRIQVAYAKAGNNSQTYVQLMNDLINLKIPDEVTVGKSAEGVSFYPDQDLIDFDLYSQVETSNYSGEDFTKLVSRWNSQNLDTTLTYKEIVGIYDGNPETLANSFDIQLKEKTDMSYYPLLFMKNLEDIKFGGEYNVRNISEGYIYFPLKEKTTRFVFITTEEDIDFTNLPIFVAPNIENLGIQETPQAKNTTSIWIWFVIVLGILFAIMIIVYFVLQKWYSTRYEEFLFKDKNEFYNIAAFIDNAKRSGQSDSEIVKRLKKAGWSSEQIKFAMKKYSGKETGMAKLPLTGKTSAKKPVNSQPQRSGTLTSTNQKKLFRK